MMILRPNAGGTMIRAFQMIFAVALAAMTACATGATEEHPTIPRSPGKTTVHQPGGSLPKYTPPRSVIFGGDLQLPDAGPATAADLGGGTDPGVTGSACDIPGFDTVGFDIPGCNP